MIYACAKQALAAKRKAFISKWRLQCRTVADSLEEADDKLFAFARFRDSQWKSMPRRMQLWFDTLAKRVRARSSGGKARRNAAAG